MLTQKTGRKLRKKASSVTARLAHLLLYLKVERAN